MHRAYGPPVLIGEISVVVAVAGPHRVEVRETLDGVVEGMKSWLPVWKKETYGGGGERWKENADWALREEGVKVDAGADEGANEAGA
ncbi:hypothetical protein TeGR_g934 [Tetraparma gracilis]|uniref:Molybdopterin synthase catalytic subunit n=1 Tax=Tetraparma gracilis TaxID=2962635 RepID=A0ABQ6MG77_9STRA|nr:hypothetical protein TeGR_g934 [Tetraparma gracilis]